MPEEKEIIDKKEPGSCVVHDDTFGWGGPDEAEEKEILKEKIKKITDDEPVNWPYNRFRYAVL